MKKKGNQHAGECQKGTFLLSSRESGQKMTRVVWEAAWLSSSQTKPLSQALKAKKEPALHTARETHSNRSHGGMEGLECEGEGAVKCWGVVVVL